MEYRIRHFYSGIETYVLEFIKGNHEDSRVCYSGGQLIDLITEADSQGHTRADGWLDGIKDCTTLYRFVTQKIVDLNKIDADILIDRMPVDYYDYTGYGNESDYVAVKGIDYDWNTESVRVNLYILTFDEKKGDWHATNKVRSVSLDYFKKAFKFAGSCYLY